LSDGTPAPKKPATGTGVMFSQTKNSPSFLGVPSLLGSLIMLLPLSRIVLVDFFDPSAITLASFVVKSRGRKFRRLR
jgi:hypothetical protein